MDKLSAPNTAKKLANKNKINEKTVRRYGQLATEFEEMEVEKPELAKDISNGKLLCNSHLQSYFINNQC